MSVIGAIVAGEAAAGRGDPALNENWTYAKGSPEMMLTIMRKDSVPENYSEMLKKYASMGLRLLAVASKRLPPELSPKTIDRSRAEEGLEFNGFEVFENKLKPETVAAITELTEGLIPSVMITGDNSLTGSSIAYKCGIADPSKDMIIVDEKGGALVTEMFRMERAAIGSAVSKPVVTQQLRSTAHIHSKVQPSDSLDDSVMGKTLRLIRSLNERAESENLQFCLSGAAFNRIFPSSPDPSQPSSAPGASPEENPEYLSFFNNTKVFCRAKPNDKARIVMFYQKLGKRVSMCGDGANDCGALKQADVGLSLSQTEASISAPFTSKVANIQSLVNLLKECQAGLVTNFSLFNIMALYSLTQYTSTLICIAFYSYPADMAYLYWDMACNFFFFLTIGYTGTAERLASIRPRESLFTVSNMVSLLIMFLTQAAGQIGIVAIMIHHFADPLSYFSVGGVDNNYNAYLANIDEGTNNLTTATIEGSVVFMFSNFMYIASVLAFSIASPWRKYFFTNLPFMIVLVVVFVYCVVLVLVPEARLKAEANFHFQIGETLVYAPFNGLIVGLAMLFGIVMYVNETFLLRKFWMWLRELFPEKHWI